MTATPRFQDAIGLQTIDKIVRKCIPKWSSGLRPTQRETIPIILDCQHLGCILQTGSGKSALYAVPIICHLEISANPTVYPEFRGLARRNPVGIVVTPTKGLAGNIVCNFSGGGVDL